MFFFFDFKSILFRSYFQFLPNFLNSINKRKIRKCTYVTRRPPYTSELVVVKNVNNILENRIVSLEKPVSKVEQYERRNNVEISRI